MNIKERFEKFSRNGYFSRADEHHLLELYIGLDEKGRKCMEYRYAFNPVRIRGTEAIEISQYTKLEYNTLRFSLLSDDIASLFYKFCEDIIEQTRPLKYESEGYNAILSRFSMWKKLFVQPKNKYLNESEIMGLMGEILFLKGDLAKEKGISTALECWSGQSLTHKDFSCIDTWYEVKSISSGKTTVKISSLEQLESKRDGELVVFQLERMSPAYDGINLNKLFIETYNLFSNDEDKNEFSSKSASQGYEYSDYYDNYVYEIIGYYRFYVSSSFPKLTTGNVPSAVLKATYEISLPDIMKYKKN